MIFNIPFWGLNQLSKFQGKMLIFQKKISWIFLKMNMYKIRLNIWPKLPENGLNDPKIIINIPFRGSNQFPKFQGKMLIFQQKIPWIFLKMSMSKIRLNIWPKMPENGLNDPKIIINIPFRGSNQFPKFQGKM